MASACQASRGIPLPEAGAEGRARPWWQEWQFCLLLVLTACFFGIRVTDLSVRGEESRRGRIAWEMWHNGDWIVPRIQGEPVFFRPPLQNWLIALVGMLHGEVDSFALRIPSVVAILLAVGVTYGYARSFLSRFGAFTCGLALASLGQVLELGRLGETDALFHGSPGGVLQWEFARRGDDFVAGLPVERVGHGDDPGTGAGSDGHFLGLSADELRDVCANAIGNLVKDGIGPMVRMLFVGDGGLNGAQRDFGHRRFAGEIEIGRVFELEPLLPPVGVNRNAGCCHESPLSMAWKSLDSRKAQRLPTSKLETPADREPWHRRIPMDCQWFRSGRAVRETPER